ncbi:MAG TPA: hypothetical protein VM529_03995 [Gemmata sp.]|jgi:hypothetical protein|nr:hypothetical protein [Gemmata sp.]
MTPATPTLSPEEIAERGQSIFERRVRPQLKPADDGKYVAIDVATEDYEVDDNDWEAVSRLSARRRGALISVVRVGKPYRMSYRMRFPQ